MAFGVIVELEEYGGKEGFIHISEISRGWVKRIIDHIREGQRVVCKVLDVDPSRNRIDLSLKSVNPHQKREKISDWKNEQKAENLLRIVADRLNQDFEICYGSFGKKLAEAYGSLYSAFEEAAANGIDGFEEKWVGVFEEVAKENIEIPFVMIRGNATLTTIAPDGVEKIKKVLKAVEAKGADVRYLGAPNYLLEIECEDYRSAEEIMKGAVKAMLDSAKKLCVDAKFERTKG